MGTRALLENGQTGVNRPCTGGYEVALTGPAPVSEQVSPRATPACMGRSRSLTCCGFWTHSTIACLRPCTPNQAEDAPASIREAMG